ncbi:hypothetical protein [Desulfotruncus alcoholivorax]|uniref:hypothetical protein n=1 Tax=Desulfotruncus alcoholivorax TaxID=265477 RepID=UPI00041206DF|nr:hypothetical protein [Desulfotruncus alcoholivorax]
MNYLTTSLWFIGASALQALTLWPALKAGLITFNPGFSYTGLFGLLVTGQIAGYLLVSFFSGRAQISGIAYGAVYGFFLWAVIALLLGPALNLFTSPLLIGFNATIITLISFLVYGVVAGYASERTVKQLRG